MILDRVCGDRKHTDLVNQRIRAMPTWSALEQYARTNQSVALGTFLVLLLVEAGLGGSGGSVLTSATFYCSIYVFVSSCFVIAPVLAPANPYAAISAPDLRQAVLDQIRRMNTDHANQLERAGRELRRGNPATQETPGAPVSIVLPDETPSERTNDVFETAGYWGDVFSFSNRRQLIATIHGAIRATASRIAPTDILLPLFSTLALLTCTLTVLTLHMSSLPRTGNGTSWISPVLEAGIVAGDQLAKGLVFDFLEFLQWDLSAIRVLDLPPTAVVMLFALRTLPTLLVLRLINNTMQRRALLQLVTHVVVVPERIAVLQLHQAGILTFDPDSGLYRRKGKADPGAK